MAGKLESQWSSPHFAPTLMAQQFPVSPQSSQTAFTTLVPLTPPAGPILAEQMKALSLSGMMSLVYNDRVVKIHNSVNIM